MPLFGTRGAASVTGFGGLSKLGYLLRNSLRFRDSVSAYLNRTPASASNLRTWTWSGWVKRGTLGSNDGLFSAGTSFGTNNDNIQTITFTSGDALLFVSEVSGSSQFNLTTSQLFRDPAAWYHIVVAFDTTQGTSSNRIKLYVNGSQVTAFSTSTYPSPNYDGWINSANAHRIGNRVSPDFDGYMAEINFVDGLQLDASSFGKTDPVTGQWIPKKFGGAYGTNGFYLNFTDASAATAAAIGKDSSGNGNNWTPNNISVTAGVTYDSMTDVPTLTSATVANYAVMNPLDAQGTATLSDANLTLASSTTAHKNRKATFVIPSTGKWYWELTTASTCSASIILGWGLQTTAAATDSQAGNADTFMAHNDGNQDIYNQTTNVFSGGSAVSANAIRQVAYDADTGKLWFGINNVWYSSTDLTSGNPSAGTNQCMTLSAGSYFPTITCYNLTANVNFGQRPFTYTPPSGFKSLNTFNLP